MAHWNPRLLKFGDNPQDQVAAPDLTLRSLVSNSSHRLVSLRRRPVKCEVAHTCPDFFLTL